MTNRIRKKCLIFAPFLLIYIYIYNYARPCSRPTFICFSYLFWFTLLFSFCIGIELEWLVELPNELSWMHKTRLFKQKVDCFLIVRVMVVNLCVNTTNPQLLIYVCCVVTFEEKTLANHWPKTMLGLHLAVRRTRLFVNRIGSNYIVSSWYRYQHDFK
jgi:hypothetical protein